MSFHVPVSIVQHVDQVTESEQFLVPTGSYSLQSGFHFSLAVCIELSLDERTYLTTAPSSLCPSTVGISSSIRHKVAGTAAAYIHSRCHRRRRSRCRQQAQVQQRAAEAAETAGGGQSQAQPPVTPSTLSSQGTATADLVPPALIACSPFLLRLRPLPCLSLSLSSSSSTSLSLHSLGRCL
jgi:hypothetical protein